MKLVEEALAQIRRSEFREDITDVKTSIEKEWNGKYKRRSDLFWRYQKD